MLIFSVQEVPILKKGKGVRLQRYKDDALLDIMLISSNSKDSFLKKDVYQRGRYKSLVREKGASW